MSATPLQKLLRVLMWVGFILFPVAFTLAMMDFGAHGDASTPGIGLEGAGRPGGAATPLMMIALVGVAGGIFARMSTPEPRTPLPALGAISILAFIASMLAARPVFHWKWERDCGNDIARACFALARLRPAGDATGDELTLKACRLADPNACKHLAEAGGSGAAAGKTLACDQRKKPCDSGAWPETTCKEIDALCAAKAEPKP